jgi:CheY-like chemotaxis protein
MSGAGVIRIESARADHDGDRRRPPLADPREYVRISVIDDGRGIERGTMSRIFEPLFTTKRSGGTGLGLAVVQQVMRRHDGAVVVESSPGAGAAFHLYFRRGVLPESAAVLNVSTPRRAADRVLIVEDDESVAAGLKAILESEGISTLVVTFGRDAIPAIEAFKPDAVVLDRGLPDADGVDICRLILLRWPSLPIVFSTGHGSRADLEEMLDLSNVVHLLKPYDIETLLDSMAQAMSG